MINDIKFNSFGAPRNLPDNQPEVTAEVHKAWCKQRVLGSLKYKGLGYLGNAFGQLNADLMRHAATKHLMEKLHALPATEQALRDFIEKELTD